MPGAFQKSFVDIREICQPIGRGELHSAAFKRALQIHKAMVLSA
jgi:hypothetical protein